MRTWKAVLGSWLLLMAWLIFQGAAGIDTPTAIAVLEVVVGLVLTAVTFQLVFVGANYKRPRGVNAWPVWNRFPGSGIIDDPNAIVELDIHDKDSPP